MTPQTERAAATVGLVLIATAFVLLGYLTGSQWVTFVQWVIGFVLAHHIATSTLAKDQRN